MSCLLFGTALQLLSLHTGPIIIHSRVALRLKIWQGFEEIILAHFAIQNETFRVDFKLCGDLNQSTNSHDKERKNDDMLTTYII